MRGHWLGVRSIQDAQATIRTEGRLQCFLGQGWVPGAELKWGPWAMGRVWGEAPGKAGQSQEGPLGPGWQPRKAQQLTLVLVYFRDLLGTDVLGMTAFFGKIAVSPTTICEKGSPILSQWI